MALKRAVAGSYFIHFGNYIWILLRTNNVLYWQPSQPYLELLPDKSDEVEAVSATLWLQPDYNGCYVFDCSVRFCLTDHMGNVVKIHYWGSAE